MTTRTLYDIFGERSRPEFAQRPYILHKPKRGEPYETVTFGEFTRRTTAFAAALEQLGLRRGDRILIVSESRPQWMITDLATVLLGAISVPVFPTLTAHQTQYILRHCSAVAAVVSSEYQLRKIVGGLEASPELRFVIIMNRDVELPQNDRVRFLYFSDLEANGAGRTPTPVVPTPEDITTIIYTSGTTGNPKGVMLTHRNIVSNVESALAAIPSVDPDDLFLSFLPLSHGFERIASYLKFTVGVPVAYAESIDSVSQNMLEVRPTVMTAVPRFFERVYSRIEASRASMSPLRRQLFDWGMRIGEQHAAIVEGRPAPLGARLLYPLADRLVLSKIRARTGGRIRFLVSGGAALKPELGRAFAAIGLCIIEGYGLTETSPVVAVSRVNAIRWGTVGPPIPGVEIRIADDGEILIRGENVMRGYYRDEEATAEMIDHEGWLHSGDIGRFDEAGRLQITDRKKHLIILANGKNIAPAPIEALLESSPLIDQVIVLGEQRDYCSALVVVKDGEHPDPSILHKQLELEISKANRELASYEKIRRFRVLSEPFTIENGMLTPTLKVRRKEVERRFQDIIESMYSGPHHGE